MPPRATLGWLSHGAASIYPARINPFAGEGLFPVKCNAVATTLGHSPPRTLTTTITTRPHPKPPPPPSTHACLYVPLNTFFSTTVKTRFLNIHCVICMCRSMYMCVYRYSRSLLHSSKARSQQTVCHNPQHLSRETPLNPNPNLYKRRSTASEHFYHIPSNEAGVSSPVRSGFLKRKTYLH